MSDIIFVFSGLYYFFVVAEVIVSAIMCVYGYKWRRGLIATLSLYIGLGIGLFLAGVLMNVGAGLESAIIVILIITLAFWFMAYKVVPLNHFLAGFLLTVKISYMILYTLLDNEVLELDIKVLFIAPIVIGIISGLIVTLKYNNYIVVMCVSFIGAVNLGSRIAEMISKGTFLLKPEIGYFVNWDTILNFLGIETVSLLEAILILVVFMISFIAQKKRLEMSNIDMSDVPMDDRKYYNSEE